MHFALPPRKTSQPPPYARRNRNSFFNSTRRRLLQIVALVGLGLIGAIYILSTALRQGNTHGALHYSSPPSGTPEIVVVTVLDEENYPSPYLEKIKENRINYAKRHGYASFIPSQKDYFLEHAPESWSLIPAVRHALTKFPYTTWVFYLAQDSLIMNSSLPLSRLITDSDKIEQEMQRNVPVVPPESVIRTFTHLTAPQVDLIISQDGTSLSHGSFLLRNYGSVDSSGRREDGAWARFFLDSWFDPLYRSYNFQKAEGHALEHIVQWHPTILAKLALVPQRLFNSYAMKTDKTSEDSMYQDGDFVIRLNGCEGQGSAKCESDMEPFYAVWKSRNSKAS